MRVTTEILSLWPIRLRVRTVSVHRSALPLIDVLRSTALCRVQVLAEVVQTGRHAAMELQYVTHDGNVVSIPLEFAAVEPSKGDALAVLHAMWCAARPMQPHPCTVCACCAMHLLLAAGFSRAYADDGVSA